MKKNRTKKVLVMLLAVFLTVALLPITVFAADDNSDGYDDGDVAAIQAIINASPTLREQVDTAAPDTWGDIGMVRWSSDSPKRVIELSLSSSLPVTDFSGTLDVSALTALELLNCDNNIGLTELILPQSNSLTDLACFNTGITELNVSGCPALTSLECYNTGISELNVSNNVALTTLDCFNTNISSLDVSNLTGLTYLSCSGTKITSLEVSNNTALTTLDCTNTGITVLDVSGNAALETLHCDNTQITTLNLSVSQSLKNLRLPKSLEQLGTPEGYRITLTQRQEGNIMLESSDLDAESGNLFYQLQAIPQPGYEFVRWNGVTNFVNGTTENDAQAMFNITGDMNISAEFSVEERLSLVSLVVEGATLTPAFSSDILNYTAVVPYDVTSINIVAEGLADYEHEITGTGKHELEVGENTFVVAVIVPKVSGDPNINETLRQEYVITVTRQAEPNLTSEVTPTPEGELDAVPQTGDDSNIGLWVGLMMIGFAGMIVCISAWGRKRTN